MSSKDKRKVNQDTIIKLPKFTLGGRSLFGVCDGHGAEGHLVAMFVK
jgi:serine/threonine protein phosphatase PrpC